VDYRIAWPIPLHQQPAYAAGFPAGTRYPVAEDVASRLLTLPLFHAMTDEQQDYVIDTVRAAVGAAPLATAGVR
jgi:dTDP-4-amino-4,6-dideoxygalactose transaminase